MRSRVADPTGLDEDGEKKVTVLCESDPSARPSRARETGAIQR